MKKSYTLLITLITILFVSFAIISFMNYFSLNKNSQYTKDLAELRGYWAAYGARKFNADMTYFYQDSTVNSNLYNLNGIKDGSDYTFTITDNVTGADVIRQEDIHIRVLKTDNASKDNIILSYTRE